MAAGGLASFFASLTGPDGPDMGASVSKLMGGDGGRYERARSSRVFLGQAGKSRTFGLGEVALLNTRFQSFVEHGIKLVIGCDCEVLVVGLDIFFECLTAVVVELISKVPPDTNATGRSKEKSKDQEWGPMAYLLPDLSFSYCKSHVSHHSHLSKAHRHLLHDGGSDPIFGTIRHQPDSDRLGAKRMCSHLG